MKKSLTRIMSLVALLFLMGSVASWGQQAKLTPEQRQAKQVDQFAQKLGLDADQKAKVLAIHKAHQQKVQAASKKQYSSQEDCRAAMRPLRMEKKQAIEAVLSPAQKVKWEQMRQPANNLGQTRKQ